MAQQLKRWESPRHEGRNNKGRGGSAKHRQYIKRQKRLRKRLQAGINDSASGAITKGASANDSKATEQQNSKKGKKREAYQLLFFCGYENL